jgi:hypothetical protein
LHNSLLHNYVGRDAAIEKLKHNSYLLVLSAVLVGSLDCPAPNPYRVIIFFIRKQYRYNIILLRNWDNINNIDIRFLKTYNLKIKENSII